MKIKLKNNEYYLFKDSANQVCIGRNSQRMPISKFDIELFLSNGQVSLLHGSMSYYVASELSNYIEDYNLVLEKYLKLFPFA